MDPSPSVPVCPRPCAGGKANQNSSVLTRGKNCPSTCDHDGLKQPVAARVSSGFLIAVIMGRAFYACQIQKSSIVSTLRALHNRLARDAGRANSRCVNDLDGMHGVRDIPRLPGENSPTDELQAGARSAARPLVRRSSLFTSAEWSPPYRSSRRPSRSSCGASSCGGRPSDTAGPPGNRPQLTMPQV